MAKQEPMLVQLSVDGKTVYDVLDYSIHETLSEVPEYRVTIHDQITSASALLGKPCQIDFVQGVYADAKPRIFAGIVMSVERVVTRDGSPALTVTIRPPMAILALSQSCAVYEKKTALEILKIVLERNNLKRMKITGSRPTKTREVVIQYNENDLDFVRRILAEEGLTFYFHDGSSAETMVVHDTQKPFPNKTGICLSDAELSDIEQIEAGILSVQQRLCASKVELLTYDPKNADRVSASESTKPAVTSAEKPAVLAYRPVTVPLGQVSAGEIDVAVDALRRDEFGLSGSCEHPGMYLGQPLSIKSAGHADIAGDYIIVAIEYTPVRGNAVECRFNAVPTSHKPSPHPLPKPQIAGVHNAIVIGGSHSKLGDPYCDAQGRVHVRFFWDTSGENTIWLRVAEPYAGKGYGAQFIPRVGHEVLVSFLHGDPDAPIITGQIYNTKNKPPFIEKNTTRSGIRSKLAGEANEWEFDDKQGKELIAIRAARDFNVDVRNDAVFDIANDDTILVGANRKLTVQRDFVTKVAETIKTSAKRRETAIDQDETLTAKTITLEADSKLVLKVGASSIELTSAGIKISTNTLTVEGKSKVDVTSSGALGLKGMKVDARANTALNLQGLQVSLKASAMLQAQGAICDVKGSGMIKMQGGLCMIN